MSTIAKRLQNRIKGAGSSNTVSKADGLGSAGVTPNSSILPNSNNRSKITSLDPHCNTAGSGSYSKPGMSNSRGSRESWNIFPVDNLVPSAFDPSAPSQMDIRIVGAPTHTLKDITFEITLQNTTGNIMTLSHPSTWFSRLEIMSDGVTTDETVYPVQHYLDAMLDVTDEERADFSRTMHYNPITDRSYTNTSYECRNYDSPSTAEFQIPANSSKRFYFKLSHFLQDVDLFLLSLNAEPRLRFYTGNQLQTTTSAAYLASAASFPTLTQFNIYNRGTLYKGSIAAMLAKRYSSRKSATRILTHERQTYSQTITSGTECADILLTGLNGQYAYLVVIVSEVGLKQNEIYSDHLTAAARANGATWKKLYDITLLDSNQTALNKNKMSVEYLQNNVFPHHFNSAITYEKELIVIPFAESCRLAKHYDCGSMTMDGNWVLRFTPTSIPTYNVIPASLAVEVAVYGYRYGEFAQLPGGGVSFSKFQ